MNNDKMKFKEMKGNVLTLRTKEKIDRKQLKSKISKISQINKRDKEKIAGITLVALVITIVVLIILATVSINMLFGENGLVTKAQQATQLTEEASAMEDMGIYLASVKGAEAQEENFRLADYLSNNIGNNGLEDFLNNGDGYGQVSYNGNKFLVNLTDYTYTYLGKSDGTVNRRIEQVLGNNNESVPGISMVEAGEIETEDLGWRVLSVNKDGSVNLIANRNTGFEVSLSGINGYTNGVKALNEICSKLYGNLEINGVKVISARNANVEDFYNVTYGVNSSRDIGKEYTSQKIQAYINTLDVTNDGYSTEQIENYIDAGNTSGEQSSNTQMLLSSQGMTIKGLISRTAKEETASLINTGNNYWLATRYTSSYWDSQGNKIPDSEEVRYETYGMTYIRADGEYATYTTFRIDGHNTSGTNITQNCALRPVITVPAECVPDTTIGASVETDPFNKTGEDTNGYVKAETIATLLGTDVKGVNAISSGLPTIEADMTWTKLEDGGYDSLTGEFDTENYDYYIADRTTELQMRLTGASGYNNGVLAMDTVMNNLYGNLTEIKINGGKDTIKVNVVLARNAKFEDFYKEPDTIDPNSTGYGGVWSTNVNDDTAPNKIMSTNNRYVPTLFAQEDVDPSNGASDGYSDAKITTYNLSTTGTTTQLTDEQRSSYSYEYYNADPGLKVIYNAYWGEPNRNTAQASTGTAFWLSSRSVFAYLGNVDLNIRYMTDSGSHTHNSVCYSGSGSSSGSVSNCHGLRPVLQVAK